MGIIDTERRLDTPQFIRYNKAPFCFTDKKMKEIKKALFPVAGMGTRMLPATKSIPKELLPVYNTPILDLLVSECVQAGIEEIILVTSREKYLIENYFDSFPELEKKLEEKRDWERLERIQKFKNIKFSAVRQGVQNGDGHAMLCARHLLGEEPFLVIFGDELTFGTPSSVQQLITAYNTKQSCIIGVKEVPLEKISSYGVVDISGNSDLEKINGVVEKPHADKAPSNKAVIGKYVCTAEIWNALENAGSSKGGETRLIDGFEQLLKTQDLYAQTLDGERFDTGSTKGYFLANLYFALQSGEVSAEEIHSFLK